MTVDGDLDAIKYSYHNTYLFWKDKLIWTSQEIKDTHGIYAEFNIEDWMSQSLMPFLKFEWDVWEHLDNSCKNADMFQDDEYVTRIPALEVVTMGLSQCAPSIEPAPVPYHLNTEESLEEWALKNEETMLSQKLEDVRLRNSVIQSCQRREGIDASDDCVATVSTLSWSETVNDRSPTVSENVKTSPYNLINNSKSDSLVSRSIVQPEPVPFEDSPIMRSMSETNWSAHRITAHSHPKSIDSQMQSMVYHPHSGQSCNIYLSVITTTISMSATTQTNSFFH